jgi:hypothetical protein
MRGKIADGEKCVKGQNLSFFWMERVVTNEKTIPDRFYSLQESSMRR